MNSFEERLYPDHSQVLVVSQLLHRSRTRYQDVLIFENRTFGKVLVLDGVVQLTELDNHIYHEMIAHVPLTAHARPADVLIIGGGDGGTLREVLKHPVGRVVMVELDEKVIELAKQFFPGVSAGAFDDPRAEVVIADAAAFVADSRDRFDVIVIDSTDPFGPGEALFSDAFYRRCRALLRDGGMVSMQSGVPLFRPTQIEGLRNRLTNCFGSARPFLCPVPTYANGMLALFAAGESGRSLCPPVEKLRERFTSIREPTRYYGPNIHVSAFEMVPSFSASGSTAVRSTADH
jgi:spermidine synthase